MHPAMAPLKPFYDAGELGLIHAVGMAEPNRSHFSAMEEMERAAPGSSLRTGWLDRVLGLRDVGTAFQATQLGSNTASSAFLGPSQELAMWSVDSFELSGAWDATELAKWSAALGGLHTDAPAMLASPATTALGAIGTAANLQAAGYTPTNGAAYPETGLGDALKDVARLIKAGVGLQVAAIDYGDWDMHVGQGTFDTGWMHDHLTELSERARGLRYRPRRGPGRRHARDAHRVRAPGRGERLRRHRPRIRAGRVDDGRRGQGRPGARRRGRASRPNQLIDGDLNATTDYREVLAEILEKRCGAASVSGIFPGLDSDRPGVVNPRV